MLTIKILIPNGLSVPTPQGEVSFPPNTWVELKPKWSLNPNLDVFTSQAKALGVKVLDQNEDITDLAGLSDEEAERFARKCFVYMQRFL